MKKNLLLLALAIVFYYVPSFSQSLYTNTTETTIRLNPGIGSNGTPLVLLDDVQIPSTQVQGTDSVSITNIKFGIRRLAAAPAVTVNFYYTPFDTLGTTYDDIINIPPVLIGTIDLPANGATSVTAIISVGDSINSLFKVKTDTGYLYTGYQTLFLGLSFSDSSSLNGWRVTNPDNFNDDVMWLYNADSTTPRFASYFGGTPPATFYLDVFGKGVLNTVPVTLGQFSAHRVGSVNILNWSTQEELNTRNFVVERSNDGKKFAGIGEVNATGTTGTVHQYTFTDSHPAKGINYYRLRIVDKDNLFKLSPTRSISNLGLADISIFPNPVTDKVIVSINADKATEGYLTINDMNGKAVYSRSLQVPSGSSTIPVTVNNFAAGSYIMKIQLNDDIIIKKFNKQ